MSDTWHEWARCDRPLKPIIITKIALIKLKVKTLKQIYFTKFSVNTGPLTHSVGGHTSNGRWRHLSSSSVTLHDGHAGGFTRAGQVIMSCHLQSNYSSTVTLHGGPVVLLPLGQHLDIMSIIKTKTGLSFSSL